MPDTWEKARGLNPNDASDGSTDRNGDGYSNVEEYINGLVVSAASQTALKLLPKPKLTEGPEGGAVLSAWSFRQSCTSVCL